MSLCLCLEGACRFLNEVIKTRLVCHSVSDSRRTERSVDRLVTRQGLYFFDLLFVIDTQNSQEWSSKENRCSIKANLWRAVSRFR